MRVLCSLTATVLCFHLVASVRVGDVCDGVFGPVEPEDRGICSLISGASLTRRRRADVRRSPRPSSIGFTRLSRSAPWAENTSPLQQGAPMVIVSPMHSVKKRSVDAVKHTASKRSFMRFGRDPEKVYEKRHFVRFGRGGEDEDKMDDDMKEAFVKLGEAFMKLAEEKNLNGPQDIQKAFEKYGQDPESKRAFMRFGRNPEESKRAFMRFGRAFVRFGRGQELDEPSKKAFVRFGKKDVGDQQMEDEPDKRSFMRFGKRLSNDKENAMDKKAFMRFGKRGDEEPEDKRSFMRFGKRDVESAQKHVRELEHSKSTGKGNAA